MQIPNKISFGIMLKSILEKQDKFSIFAFSFCLATLSCLNREDNYLHFSGRAEHEGRKKWITIINVWQRSDF